jgi:CubicO group peptidase (beta-lactamase class C family)
MSIETARRVLADAISARVFPAAVAEVGASGGAKWREAMGRLTFDEEAPPAAESTAFDLASLTKVIATTSLALELVSDNRVRLADAVASYFFEWRGPDREQVTVQDLLEHASGLSPRLADTPPEQRREFEHDICTMKLEYEPRTRSVYSDLGFILLGFAVADTGGASLAAQFDIVRERLATIEPVLRTEPLTFELDAGARRHAAPTLPMADDLRRGRSLVGEVHDSYAATLGGWAGHAGLFGTATAVGAFARGVLRAARGDTGIPAPLSPALVKRATTRSSVPGSSRALGWDTMLPSSSCGSRMTEAAFGHVGFTGTSLWIDPIRDRYFVLLTNRACGGGTPEVMQAVRRSFHDEIGDF